MLKKFVLLTLAMFALAACNSDKEDNGPRFATENPYIADGFLTGHNMHFQGTSTSVPPQGETFVDKKAYFEFAGGDVRMSIYMHATRFVSGMPAVEMKIPLLEYTGTGNKVTYTTASIVPEAFVPAIGDYKPMPQYTLSNLDVKIDGIDCKVSFTCMGFQVAFDGKLLDE